MVETTTSTAARQIAQAVRDFEKKVRGHAPRSVSVVLGKDTVVVTLHGALTPAERALAQSPDGAARVQELHRRLFDGSAAELREEIRRITGVAVREAAAEIEPATGTVVKVFTTGTTVQVFLLAGDVPASSWSDSPGGDGDGRGSVGGGGPPSGRIP